VAAVSIGLAGTTIIVGNYGSGKTEVAIHLALAHTSQGVRVRLADLDLINPYFRTREARALLAAHDIEPILPASEHLHADLPILSPAVAGAIRNTEGLTLLDVGGDAAGATVLAALGDALQGRTVAMLQVINPFRPFTQTHEGCRRIRGQIERAAGLSVTGLIGNANLIDETSCEDILFGYHFVRELAAASTLPLVCITAAEHLRDRLPASGIECPVLTIRRQLVPPWLAAPLPLAGSALPPSGRTMARRLVNSEADARSR
jgi:hypothetical protein